VAFSAFLLAKAQVSFPPAWDKGIHWNSLSLQSITQLLVNLIQVGLAVAGVVAIIFIIIGGIKYTTSGGSPDGTKSAKSTLSHAIGGLVIVALAYFIVGYLVGLLD
jgi:hypothetical protein